MIDRTERSATIRVTEKLQVLQIVTGTNVNFHFPGFFHGGLLLPSEQTQFFIDPVLVSVLLYLGLGDVIIDQCVAIPNLVKTKTCYDTYSWVFSADFWSSFKEFTFIHDIMRKLIHKTSLSMYVYHGSMHKTNLDGFLHSTLKSCFKNKHISSV